MAQASIVVIGASAGGVSALRALVAGLPEGFSAPILVVLHTGAHPSTLPGLLNAVGALSAKHAEDGETIQPGTIYVAPPDRHMTVAGRRLRLSRGPKENWARPAIDPLFRSAAAAYGAGVVGIILTGNLNDGTTGLLEIKRQGGIAIAQDPVEAAYPEMPGSAASHVPLDYCLPVLQIAKLLVEVFERKDGGEAAMPNDDSRPSASPERLADAVFERPVAMTCPECGGALRRHEVGSIVKFDCHIGHSYTAEVMALAHFDELERVMRAAVRFLNERAEFCLQMAEHAESAGTKSANWHAASRQALDRAYKLRDLVEQDWITPEAADPATSTDEDRLVAATATDWN